jgi:hypothetical protein
MPVDGEDVQVASLAQRFSPLVPADEDPALPERHDVMGRLQVCERNLDQPM